MSIEGKDLPRIIRACKASGVTKLKVGEIEIEFGVSQPIPVQPTSETVLVPTAEQLKATEENSNIQENVEFVEDQLAHMAVESPELLEQLLIEKELESANRQTGH